jgi:hypothetical protein
VTLDVKQLWILFGRLDVTKARFNAALPIGNLFVEVVKEHFGFFALGFSVLDRSPSDLVVEFDHFVGCCPVFILSTE